MQENSTEITVLGEIRRDTGVAVLFVPRGKPISMATWLPKSQIAIVHGTDGPEITMPLWLAEHKEIL